VRWYKETKKKEMVDEFGEYDDELTQKLRLKTIKRTALATTYEKAIKIIADKNIKSKDSYYELCERDNRLSKEPNTRSRAPTQLRCVASIYFI
jgi:hypothetical protein